MLNARGIWIFALVLFTCQAIFSATDTWLGQSIDWNAAANWSTKAPPQPADDIVIPGGLPAYPVLTKTTALAGSLKIGSGARLLVEGSLGVKPGKLQLDKGGELWLGVVRKGEQVIDVALKINTPLTPDITPEITPAPVPDMTPSTIRLITNDIGPAIPAATKLVNIARFASIRTTPYLAMARLMVDRDEKLSTIAYPEPGIPAKSVRFEFRYAKPQTFAAVRWAVVAGPWAILADTTGNGQYDRLLRMDLEGKLSNPGGVWASRAWVNNYFWPPVKAYGIQIVSLLGTLSDNRLYDVQLLVPAGSTSFKPATPNPKVPEAVAGDLLAVPDPPAEQQFRKGFHIEPWMFNLSGWAKMNPRAPLTEYAGFTDFVKGVKQMHGNVVNMWPPITFETKGPGEYESDLLWPSKYDRHSVDENLLKAGADALHAAGIKLSVMQRNSYPKPLAEFPVTATSTLDAACIDRPAREYLMGVVKEQAASGVDGVGIGYDEQGNWGMLTNVKGQSDFTKKAFEEQFKTPFPTEPGDTASYRKWVVFAYEQFASYLADAASGAKAVNPAVFTKSPVHVALGALWNSRLNVGIAEDIVGHMADIDYLRANGYETGDNLGHYVTAASTVRMMGANKSRGTDALLNCPWANDPVQYPGYYRDFTPMFMYGPPISHIMHGGKMPLFWRYNFAFYGGYDKYVGQSYALLDTLAAWGAKDATVPHSIAVLKSRASEDWWQLRQRYGADGNPLDQARGFLVEKWLLEFLFTNGYPFEMYYLDQPEGLANLSQYQLVILPFPYSISKAAYARLADAASKGTKILVLDRKGEVDEWGEPYAQPLLNDLIAQKKASFCGDDVTSVGHFPAMQDQMHKLVDGLLGARKPLNVNTYDSDVEVGLLEKGAAEKFVFAINWTEYPVKIDVGVNNLPAGQYELFQRDLTDAHKVRLGGKDTATARTLKQFRVSLAAGEVKVFYIHPAGK